MGNRGHDLARTGPALLLASCLLFMAGPLFALASDSHSGSGQAAYFQGQPAAPEANEPLRLLAQPNGSRAVVSWPAGLKIPAHLKQRLEGGEKVRVIARRPAIQAATEGWQQALVF